MVPTDYHIFVVNYPHPLFFLTRWHFVFGVSVPDYLTGGNPWLGSYPFWGHSFSHFYVCISPPMASQQ